MTTPEPPAKGGVKLPVIGQTPAKWLIVGGGAVVVIVGYAYLKKRKAAASATPYDTTTGSLTGGAGYVNPNPVNTVDSTVDAPDGTITTNTQWVNDVIQKLQGTWDIGYIGAALGKFLNDAPLTTDEVAVVRAAQGVAGNPPQGNHQIIMATTSGSPGGPTTPAASRPATVYADTSVNLYDWCDHVQATYGGLPGSGDGDYFNYVLSINGLSRSGTHSDIVWTAVPGPPGTPKIPRLKVARNLKI